jgi:hypothetical protein
MDEVRSWRSAILPAQRRPVDFAVTSRAVTFAELRSAPGRVFMLVAFAWTAGACFPVDDQADYDARARARLKAGPVVLYAEADWFQSSPEPEGTWVGVLRRNPPALGGHVATYRERAFSLVTDAGQLEVYAQGIEGRLDAFVDLTVQATGKLVVLPGFGPELWLASVNVNQASTSGPARP